jgi:single-strand DNA-binding protein
MSYNKVILIGRLGKDPDVRTVGTEGNKVAELSLATSEKFKNKSTGENETKTEWHKCIFWGNIADVIGKYLKKGSQIAVEGKITTRTYDDKDGVKRYVTEIICSNMTMLDTKESGSADSGAAYSQPQAPATADPAAAFAGKPVEDDLPF